LERIVLGFLDQNRTDPNVLGGLCQRREIADVQWRIGLTKPRVELAEGQ
jgi:hypothetical protein